MENKKNTNIALCFLAIIISISLLFPGCGLMVRGAGKGYRKISHSSLFRQGRYGKLTKEETEWAKIAWKYFENNASSGTGMINSVDGYPAMTLWHWADYLAALTSARELELIGKCEFDRRLSALLQYLNQMPLFNGELPNKVYHPQTGQMIDSSGKPGQTGWSAIDIGRFLTWLKIVKCRYPVYGEYIDKAVLRWNFCRVIDDCGVLYGSVKTGDNIDIYQEGRLGYEEYAAKGFQLWGFNTKAASRIEPFKTIDIGGIRIPADARDPRETGASAPVLSMSYILPGLEFNWDRIDDNQSMDSRHTDKKIAEIAEAVYRVQERRYEKKRIFTARTDHHLPSDPFFVFDSVYADGYPWNVLSPDGTYRKESSLLATRASVGKWALRKTEDTKKLNTDWNKYIKNDAITDGTDLSPLPM